MKPVMVKENDGHRNIFNKCQQAHNSFGHHHLGYLVTAISILLAQ